MTNDHTGEEARSALGKEISASPGTSQQTWTGITAKVALGSAWGVAGQGAILVASIVATPFVLRFLSTEQYGLLSLINLLLNYLALSDLGMQPGSTRFAMVAHTQEGDLGESRVIWTSLAVTLLPGVLVALALIFGAGVLADHVFHVPLSLRTQAIFAFRAVVIILLARNLAGIANTPQLVRLRFDLYTLISSGGTVAQMLTMPLALYFVSRNVTVAVLVMVIYAVAVLLAHIVVSLRLLPALRQPRFSKEDARKLVSYGSSLAGITILTIALNSEKIVLARLGSLSLLAFYSVAYTLASLPMVAPYALGQALLPAFAKLHSTSSTEAMRNLFYRSLRLLALLTLPALFLLCIFGDPLLRMWAGPVYAANGILPLYILALGVLFDCFTAVPKTLINSIGKPHTIVGFQLAILLPYLLLNVLLIAKLGVVGAAIILTLRAVTEFLVVHRYAVKQYFSESSMRFGMFFRWFTAVGLLLSPLLFMIFHRPLLLRGLGCISVCAYIWFGHKYLLESSEKFWIISHFKRALRY